MIDRTQELRARLDMNTGVTGFDPMGIARSAAVAGVIWKALKQSPEANNIWVEHARKVKRTPAEHFKKMYMMYTYEPTSLALKFPDEFVDVAIATKVFED